METPGKRQILKEMADSRFAPLNQNIVAQLKENGKKKNTLKAKHTWKTIGTLNEVREACKVARWSNFDENIINKTSNEPARASRDKWWLVMF